MEFLDYFDRYPELTPTDLARKAGISIQKASNNLSSLYHKRLLDRQIVGEVSIYRRRETRA